MCIRDRYYDAYYKKASQVRTLIKKDFDRVFQSCDVILSPTSPTTAFGLNEKKKAEDPMEMYLSDVYTVPVNIAGLPAVSVPCGFDQQGLPVGMQLVANAYRENDLFRGAFAFEQATDFHTKTAKL